mmetsp:Transcript_61285/g.134249  ORF Transcript_61285/g.134249 Transcript_61285/m.134249 type:complete len:88 (-) Transcript_61285:1596-1859(-)
MCGKPSDWIGSDRSERRSCSIRPGRWLSEALAKHGGQVVLKCGDSGMPTGTLSKRKVEVAKQDSATRLGGGNRCSQSLGTLRHEVVH